MRVIPLHPFKQKFVINNLIQEKVLANHFFESKPDEVKFKTEKKIKKAFKVKFLVKLENLSLKTFLHFPVKFSINICVYYV